MLQFAISDTGIGISQEQVGRVFDPFVQADSTTTRRFGGSGLGLNISASLVEMLGGTIQIQSQIDVGTEIIFSIALDENIDAQRVGQEEYKLLGQPMRCNTYVGTMHALDGYRILRVEEGADKQKVVSHRLRKAGALVALPLFVRLMKCQACQILGARHDCRDNPSQRGRRRTLIVTTIITITIATIVIIAAIYGSDDK